MVNDKSRTYINNNSSSSGGTRYIMVVVEIMTMMMMMMMMMIMMMMMMMMMMMIRGQFLQSLCDNLVPRFPSSDLLQAASCLNQSSWPKNPLDKALFGEKQVAKLCKQFAVSETQAV